jgi:ATP-dependent exoDNAse (exonuclease V) beta subunit
MSEVVDWSPEQREVIEAGEPNLVVTAAAGAGKTRVLVERYLRHVEGGLKPDSILTITFTKKAAAEMKRRIVTELRARGRDEDAQIAETGPIQTIHSFCERMLRENSLEANLDPNFDILTESQSARLVLSCIREALASPLDEEPLAEPLISLLTGKVQGFGENRGPYARLENSISRVLSELRGSGANLLEVAQRHADVRTLRHSWEAHLLSDRDIPESVREALGRADGSTLHERLQKAYKMADLRAPAYLKGKPEPDAEEEALLYTGGLVQLACAAWWRLDREMVAMQALDFTALEARAVKLIEKSVVTRDRLREQYRVVMVDEAQDVNPVQYKLLDALGSESTMMVGDAQQSIYGFRQADVELFRQRAAGATAKSLTRNYRSSPGILNFVDLVFGNVWPENYRPMGSPNDTFDLEDTTPKSFEGIEIWRQDARDHAVTAQYVQQLVHEGTEKGEIAVLVRDSGGAVAMKAALEAIGIEARIAGGSERFYTRIEVRDLANALRSVADPYDDFALLSCLRSPMVGVSLDSIVMLGREHGVAERLATFEPPVEEDRAKIAAFLAWFEPMRSYADRLSAWEVLAEIFARTEYLPALARRKESAQLLANARKLLTLAAREPELGPLEYAEQIREVQDLRHKEGDAPAGAEKDDIVTIMTVHKSKGLEFHTVVLPQTDKRLTVNTPDVLVEPHNGLVVTKFGSGASLMHKYLGQKRKEREKAEEIRVFYVALTRAKCRLCICLYPPGRTESPSRMLGEVLGDGVPPGVRVRQSAPLVGK